MIKKNLGRLCSNICSVISVSGNTGQFLERVAEPLAKHRYGFHFIRC